MDALRLTAAVGPWPRGRRKRPTIRLRGQYADRRATGPDALAAYQQVIDRYRDDPASALRDPRPSIPVGAAGSGSQVASAVPLPPAAA